MKDLLKVQRMLLEMPDLYSQLWWRYALRLSRARL
jgi:hypothetical protein